LEDSPVEANEPRFKPIEDTPTTGGAGGRIPDDRVSPYRADIDGLRALAIVPVVLFHAEIPGFGGGFVGVDVFFVISGYLITSIIARELQTGVSRSRASTSDACGASCRPCSRFCWPVHWRPP
jgi:hypothetical protein